MSSPLPVPGTVPGNRAPSPGRSRLLRNAGAALALCAAVLAASAVAPGEAAEKAQGKAPGQRPSLTVETVLPEVRELQMRIGANGNIAAWQESVIGSEVSGLRLTEVQVNVGDTVRRGMLLAAFSAETVQAELALQRATLAEAEASFAEARANAERARQVQASGALSSQQVGQLLTAEATAKARVDAARAQVQSQELRLRHTRIEAPDDGIVSSRTATVGAISVPGQELFRLIRQGRLEWRGEVPAAQLHRVRAGQVVKVVTPAGDTVEGRVRMVGPTVDGTSRNALVYVDLKPAPTLLRPGMFVRGEIDMGASRALTLPQSAVLLREGFTYAYRIGDDGRVAQVKIDTGRREGDRIEVLRGLADGVRVVRSGVAFLADGDLVRIADGSARDGAKAGAAKAGAAAGTPK
ncbi:MAG: efflux RND transporter periplasmic adaptor subunit [Proteobacteria bacterium]|nr:efflux RND transporter periplasmic adaptor subunit [Pseudomonadota bacterium]